MFQSFYEPTSVYFHRKNSIVFPSLKLLQTFIIFMKMWMVTNLSVLLAVLRVTP